MTFAKRRLGPAAGAVLLAVSVAGAQTSDDPFAVPIAAADGVITVGVVEFAALPDFGGETARMMRLVDEPGTGRLFVNDMWGLVYTVSYDGAAVTRYLDLTDPRWAVDVHCVGPRAPGRAPPWLPSPEAERPRIRPEAASSASGPLRLR